MSVREIYFDSAATTKVDAKAAQKALEMMQIKYGNPSSLHNKGIAAAQELEHAREAVARVIEADSFDIVFTSGASESNVIAILRTLKPNFRSGRKIITTSIEHKSVLLCAKKLESLGYEVNYIKPREGQKILPCDLEKLVDEDTALISVMHVNNETGSIFDIRELCQVAKAKNPKALFHCDASQSFGKIPLSASDLSVDMMSFSGHKIGAPKGVGALFFKPQVKALLVSSGTQEFGIRIGTENMPGIAGFGAVCEELCCDEIQNRLREAKLLNDALRKRLISTIDNITINSPAGSSPYILNFSILGVNAQVMQNWLQEFNVFVSIGAACSKNEKSYVLKGFGLSADRINSAIRVSFSRSNILEEVEEFVLLVKEGAKQLRLANTKGVIEL